jgi:hypothetical protein
LSAVRIGTDKKTRQYHSKGYSGIGDHPESFDLQAIEAHDPPVGNAGYCYDLRIAVKFPGRQSFIIMLAISFSELPAAVPVYP